ncbi:uncharacterized protein [Myotis yumanensis]
MTWSGVTARGSAAPGLPEHRWLAPWERSAQLVSVLCFPEEPTQLWPRDLRTLTMTRNGATQLTPGPRTPDFFKSF